MGACKQCTQKRKGTLLSMHAVLTTINIHVVYVAVQHTICKHLGSRQSFTEGVVDPSHRKFHWQVPIIGRVRGTCRLKMQQQQAGWGVVLILCQQFEMQNAGSGSAMSLIGICGIVR